MNNGHEAAPHRQRRRDVRLDVVQPGAGARREVGQRAVALSQRRADQREGQAGQPRRRAVRRQGVRAAGRGRVSLRSTRKREKKCGGRRLATTPPANTMTAPPLVADGKLVAGIVRRRWRQSRIRCRLRSRHGPPVVENLHDAGAGRAGKRDVARRRLEDRRRGDVGDRQLRSGSQPGGTGESAMASRGSVVRGPATTCTPHPRSQSMSRPAPSKGTSSTRRTNRGTGTRCRRRFSWIITRGGRTVKGLINFARKRLPVLSRADLERDFVRRRHALRKAERVQEPRSEDGPA